MNLAGYVFAAAITMVRRFSVLRGREVFIVRRNAITERPQTFLGAADGTSTRRFFRVASKRIGINENRLLIAQRAAAVRRLVNVKVGTNEQKLAVCQHNFY